MVVAMLFRPGGRTPVYARRNARIDHSDPLSRIDREPAPGPRSAATTVHTTRTVTTASVDRAITHPTAIHCAPSRLDRACCFRQPQAHQRIVDGVVDTRGGSRSSRHGRGPAQRCSAPGRRAASAEAAEISRDQAFLPLGPGELGGLPCSCQVRKGSKNPIRGRFFGVCQVYQRQTYRYIERERSTWGPSYYSYLLFFTYITTTTWKLGRGPEIR